MDEVTNLRAEHEKWLSDTLAKESDPVYRNPLVRLHGRGPVGVRCKACRFLYGRRFSKTYWKCSQRVETRGPGSDHRVNWFACAKFEPLRKGMKRGKPDGSRWEKKPGGSLSG